MNFKAVLALPKMAKSAQTYKSISFIWIVWSTLYIYLCLVDEREYKRCRLNLPNISSYFLQFGFFITGHHSCTTWSKIKSCANVNNSYHWRKLQHSMVYKEIVKNPLYFFFIYTQCRNIRNDGGFFQYWACFLNFLFFHYSGFLAL